MWMQPARSRRHIMAPNHWQELPQGDWLLAQTQQQLSQWCPRMFGYHLIKLGALSSALQCDACHIRHQISLAPSGDSVGLFADVHHLPLLEGSVDVLLMAMNLNFSNDPHQVLREAERVLTQDGHLVIVVINPFSWFGMRRFWLGHQKQIPWNANLFLPSRVLDWAELLGFELEDRHQFGFGYLAQYSQPSPWFEQIGQRYAPALAAVHMLWLRKRMIPLTLTPNKARTKERRWLVSPAGVNRVQTTHRLPKNR